jgi:hypothetical protein
MPTITQPLIAGVGVLTTSCISLSLSLSPFLFLTHTFWLVPLLLPLSFTLYHFPKNQRKKHLNGHTHTRTHSLSLVLSHTLSKKKQFLRISFLDFCPRFFFHL